MDESKRLWSVSIKRVPRYGLADVDEKLWDQAFPIKTITII